MRIFIKYYLALFISLPLFAVPETLIFMLGNQTITIQLSDENWLHITEGKEENGTYKGGHDFNYFFENFIINDQNAKIYFDQNMNAYIVDSLKGDSLPTIINNLRENKPVSYHTLFPSKILTKEFVINSFKMALINNNLNKLKNKNDENTNVNYERNHFYVENQSFFVSGYFTLNEEGVYNITSFFPDLSWYYRKDFLHHKDDKFSLDRFFTYHPQDRYWIRHGASAKKIIQNRNDKKTNEFWPSPIVNLSLQLSEDNAYQVTPQLYLLLEDLEEYLNAAQVGSGEVKNKSVLDFFFDDPNNPTAQECMNLAKLFNKLIKNTKMQPLENFNNLDSIIKYLDGRFKKYFVLHHYSINVESGRLSDYHEQEIPRRSFNRFAHFANELTLLMLIYNIAKYFKPQNYTDDDWLYELGQKFYYNFQKFLIADQEIITLMDKNNLVFDLSTTLNKNVPYALNVISVENISAASFVGQKQAYKMLFAVRGINTDSFRFSIASLIDFSK